LVTYAQKQNNQRILRLNKNLGILKKKSVAIYTRSKQEFKQKHQYSDERLFFYQITKLMLHQVNY